MIDTFLQPQPVDHLSAMLSEEPLAHVEIHACGFSIDHYHDELYTLCNIEPAPGFERFVTKRKAEFLAGRYCARTVLTRLGHGDTQVPIGENRAPVWPAGILAAITHSHEYACCVAVDAKNSSLRGIGIDAEKIMPAHRADRLYTHIVSETEKHFLQSLPCPWPTTLSLVFSAKESLFKTLYPAVQQYFDFLHAEVIDIDFDIGHMTLRLLKDLTADIRSGSLYPARFVIGEDRVETLVYY